MTKHLSPRVLTHDERKAADAAFAGRPLDSAWSDAARAIYDGILAARGVPAPAENPVPPEKSEPRQEPIDQTAEIPSGHAAQAEKNDGAPELPSLSAQSEIKSREDAIREGALIDVTPIAHQVGLRLPVSFSRPLWELGITATGHVPEEEFEGRVRDVLIAFRLRLASSRVASPLVDFPALLAFPPDPIPQTCLLFAVAHQETATPMALTFLLPGEVSTNIIPFSAN